MIMERGEVLTAGIHYGIFIKSKPGIRIVCFGVQGLWVRVGVSVLFAINPDAKEFC